MEHDVPQQEGAMVDLPPGFRFHPTDEELVTHYLAPKSADPVGFTAHAVAEADLNKVEPWDLPSMATMGEREWYFFVVKDRKYPTGTRTNRATVSGYWKATGKDREIFRRNGRAVLVGMKKTLVFYTGRAPRGGKTGWVMHEYRLHAGAARHAYSLPRAATAKDEWVLCRVFKKSIEPTTMVAGGKRGAGMSGAGFCPMSSSTGADDDFGLSPCALPPLIDLAGGSGRTHPAAASFGTTPPPSSHVTCFSDVLEGHEFLNPPFLILPSAPTTTTAVAQQGGSDDHLITMDDDDSASLFFASSMDVAGPAGMVHELLDGGGWYSKGERRERLSGASQDYTGVTSEQVNPAGISSSSWRQQDMDHHEASLWISY